MGGTKEGSFGRFEQLERTRGMFSFMMIDWQVSTLNWASKGADAVAENEKNDNQQLGTG